MSRQANDQIPLGELLTKARLDKHMSRAQLAKETGISENSLIRYEKAGLEEDGQFPPSPKLAKLCFTLDISPLTTMFSCLSRDEYWELKGYTWEYWLNDHPDYEYLTDQWFTLTKENRKLATALKLLVGTEPKADSYQASQLEWVKNEARRIIEIQDAFYQQLEDLGVPCDPNKVRAFGMSTPGDPQGATRKGTPGEASPFDYAAFVRNGPDQNDPSRPEKSPTETEAASTASIEQTKGKPDE